MTNKLLEEAVYFAGQISDVVEDERYDFGIVFNGLAIASAAYIVDYCSNESINVDTDELAKVKEKFTELLNNTIEFSVMQLSEKKSSQD